MAITAAERELFLEAVAPEIRAELRADAALDARLAQLVAAARGPWPAIAVDDAAFLAFVAPRVRTAAAIEQLSAADLYLVCGWLAGDGAAIKALEEGPFREAARVLHRFDATPDLIEETKQSARALLFARHGGTPALAGYSGVGPLRAWLGITLARELLQLIRRDWRYQRLESGEMLRMADGTDPEVAYLRTLYGEEFRRAFTAALARLQPADKLLLRYSVVERLSIDDVSLLIGAHRATAARRIAAARERLLDDAREILKQSLRVDSGELQSILRLVDGELEVSVVRLLGTSDPPA